MKISFTALFAILTMVHSPCPAGDIQVRYENVTGIGKEAGVVRLDASGVIKVGNRYYTWYSRKAKDQPNYQKAYNASVWYAVSEDEGHTWVEKGEAIPKGKLGEFDSSATFTPDILVWKGKYYLYYSAVGDYFVNREYSDKARTVIGLAVADSPDGPWTKLPRPILESTRDPHYFDSFRIDDASPRVVDGKIWMYYKGRPWQGEGGIHKGIQTPMHLAVADRPEGTYQRMNGGMPVQMGGHEVGIWEQDGGVYSIIANLAPNANTLRFSPDGMEFNSRKIANLRPYAPISPAIYRPELTGGKAESRQCWGLSIGLPLSGDLLMSPI